MDEVEDSATVRGNSYSMRGALPPGQGKRVQFDDQDDGVHDRPTPQYHQRKTPSPPRPQGNQDDRAVIPIKIAEGKERFQAGAFFETPVPLPMWQRLDQSSQSKVQLARAIVSSWSTTRESAGPNPGGTAAVAAKFWTPPALEPVLHEDKEDHDQLSLKRWTYKVLDCGPGAKTIWGRSTPEILPLINDRLVHLDGFSPAEIMLGFVPKWKVMQRHVKETWPDIRHGATQEAIQMEVEEIEEGPEGLLIERMMDENGKNSKLLWSDRYRKITRHMKGRHKPPNRIPRAIQSLFSDFWLSKISLPPLFSHFPALLFL